MAGADASTHVTAHKQQIIRAILTTSSLSETGCRRENRKAFLVGLPTMLCTVPLDPPHLSQQTLINRDRQIGQEQFFRRTGVAGVADSGLFGPARRHSLSRNSKPDNMI